MACAVPVDAKTTKREGRLMLIDSYIVAVMLLALVLDALIGDPPALYRRVVHPVAAIGKLITLLEKALYNATSGARLRGFFLVIMTLAIIIIIVFIILKVSRFYNISWAIEILLAGSLIAARSLHDHVHAVVKGLEQNLESGREAIAHIVGRDPASLDEAGVARAAIESAAENFSDGVVAPVFWGIIFGLPGLVAYKTINTLDSMVGYRNDRYRVFGWAAARLDDVANFIPARLTAVLFIMSAALTPGSSAGSAYTIVRRHARRHQSPNAGWPEAAMAGALGLKLAGPRHYPGQAVRGEWIGDGNETAGPEDIRRALGLFKMAWVVTSVLLALVLICL